MYQFVLFTFFVADFSGKIKVDNRKILLIHVGIKEYADSREYLPYEKERYEKAAGPFL